MADTGGFWQSVLPGGLGLIGLKDQMDSVSDTQQNVQQGISQLQGQVAQGTSFKPWGVTSGTGTTRANKEGLGFNLGAEQQALADQLGQGASSMFSRATMDPAQREQEVFDRYMAMMEPGHQRQRQQLQQVLFHQGRMGLSSNQGGGGSPEQLALETAIQEAQLKASFGAMDQAQQEMLNYGNLGGAMMQGQYLPMQQLLSEAGYGVNNAQLAQQGQLQGAGLMAQLGLGGITADTNFENIKGKLAGDMWSAALPLAKHAGGVLDDEGGFFKWLESVTAEDVTA